jgi:CDP-diacylglycerol--glycerol-3-phosphate 3-phosphatidyltransferase
VTELRHGRIATLPNLLGVARIAATPVVMALLLADGAGTDLAAGILYTAAALSDIADGWLARRRDEVTPLGVFMDLAADKVLVAGVLIAMVEAGLVPTWIAATILIREFVVQAVRQLAAAEDVVIGARALGKAKTLTTNAGLLLVCLAADAATGGPMAGSGLGAGLEVAAFWVLVAAVVLTVVSGLAYLRGAWPIVAGRRPDL